MTVTKSARTDYSDIYPEVLSQDGQRIANQILACLNFGGLTHPKSKKLLDLGCSSGFITFHLADHFIECLGLDTDKNAIKIAQNIYQRPNLKFRHFSGNKIPFKNNSVDIVILRRVLDSASKPSQMISEIHRTLKPGGFVYFESGNKLTPLALDYHHPYFIPTSIKSFVIKKILRPQKFYINHLHTYRQYQSLFSDFKTLDLTSQILKHPSRFRFTNLTKWEPVTSHIPQPVFPLITHFLSTAFIWILRKPIPDYSSAK